MAGAGEDQCVTAYYNEFDGFAASWLRELIADGLIAPGDVDERSIVDVSADDLRGYVQHHFFAGIGGWSYALRLAGWDDDRPVWTGSCPCQPLSVSGQQRGHADSRHLWPSFFKLIAECRPATVFGEQVASKLGREWFAAVRLDLEELGYACGAADLCAASVGAPHIRQRLWWVGYADGTGRETRDTQPIGDEARPSELAQPSSHGRLGHADSTRSQRRVSGRQNTQREDFNRHAGRDGADCWQGKFIDCADGKSRLVEPGIFPLAHGIPNRVGVLRGAGNAIVPQVAAEFIRAAYG